jgi:hypothetical protein
MWIYIYLRNEISLLLVIMCVSVCFTQGLAGVRQVVYHLNHCTSPFSISYLWNRVSLCPGWPSPQTSIYAFLNSRPERHMPLCPAIGWDGGSHELLAQASNGDPPNLCLSNGFECRLEPLHSLFLFVCFSYRVLTFPYLPWCWITVFLSLLPE